MIRRYEWTDRQTNNANSRVTLQLKIFDHLSKTLDHKQFLFATLLQNI